MTARRGRAHLLLVCAVCGVAFALWQQRRRHRALQPRLPVLPARPLASAAAQPVVADPGAARPAWPPPASADAETWALPPPSPLHATWLRRAGVAVHLGQQSELASIGGELEVAGYPAAAGVLGNYALLLERSSASRSRILVEVTRLLSAALAEPPTSTRPRARRRDTPASKTTHDATSREPADEARTSGPTPGPRAAGTAPPIPMPRPREAPSSGAPRSPAALPERRRIAR
jgi:hypothetical protein